MVALTMTLSDHQSHFTYCRALDRQLCTNQLGACVIPLLLSTYYGLQVVCELNITWFTALLQTGQEFQEHHYQLFI